MRLAHSGGGGETAAAKRIWRIAAIAAAATALALMVGWALIESVPRSSLPLIFLVGVLSVAALSGVTGGIVTAILSSITFNFFFIPPIFTFRIAERQEIIAFIVYIIAAIVTGSIAGRMRQEADAARRHATTVQGLSDFCAALSVSSSRDEVLFVTGKIIMKTSDAPTVLLTAENSDLVLVCSWPDAVPLLPADWSAANEAWRRRRLVPRPADHLDEQRFNFHPVAGASGIEAVFGVGYHAGAGTDDPALDVILNHAEIALARLGHAEEAAAARAAAEKEQMRNAVLSSLSHDLRTPLATILGSVSALRELGVALPDEARSELLQTAEDEARRLSAFVANLLDMTRLEAGALQPRQDWVDLVDPAHGALTRAKRLHSSVAFVFSRGPGLELARTDAVILEQILFNLLDNAARYGGGDGPVALHLAMAAGRADLSVTDAGPGIPLERQSLVFEKFVTGGGGTGLGLTVARAMTAALGAELIVESPVRGGRGARFVLRLSLPAQPPRMENHA